MNNKTRHITPPPTDRAPQDFLADTNSPLYSFLTNPFSLDSFKSWIDTTFLGNIDTLIAPKDYSSVLPQDSARYFKSYHCVANIKKSQKKRGASMSQSLLSLLLN